MSPSRRVHGLGLQPRPRPGRRCVVGGRVDPGDVLGVGRDDGPAPGDEGAREGRARSRRRHLRGLQPEGGVRFPDDYNAVVVARPRVHRGGHLLLEDHRVFLAPRDGLAYLRWVVQSVHRPFVQRPRVVGGGDEGASLGGRSLLRTRRVRDLRVLPFDAHPRRERARRVVGTLGTVLGGIVAVHCLPVDDGRL